MGSNPVEVPNYSGSAALRSCLNFIYTVAVRIDHSTAACLVAMPLNESEAGGDLALIETSLLLLC